MSDEYRNTVYSKANERLKQEKAYWRQQADQPFRFGVLMMIVAGVVVLAFGFPQVPRQAAIVWVTFLGGLGSIGYGVFCKFNPLP